MASCLLYGMTDELFITNRDEFAGADGATITVERDRKDVRIRLHGTACPEGNQDFSKEAKQFTTKMDLNKTVEVEQVDCDRRYGRPVPVGFM